MKYPPPPDPEQVIHEARAKIFWGEPADDAILHMRIHGFTAEEAAEHADAMYRERLAAIRSAGTSRLVVGAGMASVPVIAWIGFSAIGIMSVTVLTLMGVALTFGLWGVWKFCKGVIMITAPQTQGGGVADM